jgi:Na+/H+-dicarboxylate symporter
MFFPLSRLYTHLYKLVDEKLYARVLAGLFLGLIMGIILSPDSGWVDQEVSQTVTNWLAMPGNLFLRLIQMIMIPLVFASIIQGIAGGQNLEHLKSIGLKVAFYFLFTTVFSILFGVSLALFIGPGDYVDAQKMQESMGMHIAQSPEADIGPQHSLNIPQRITNVLPSNPLQAMISGEMLSIVIFSIIIGIALLTMPAKSSSPVLDLLFSVQEICMTITRWAMKIAPLAVFGLICQITAKVGFNALTGLGVYIVTVWIGLFILLFFYLIIIKFFTNHGPLQFLKESKDVLLLAFSMASSAAVIPLSIKTAEESLKIRPAVSRFIIPLGATINMNGTALYQAIATIFWLRFLVLSLIS